MNYLKFIFIALITIYSDLSYSQIENKKTEKTEYSANTYLYWASVYHQKRVFDTAYFCYQMAIKLDSSNIRKIIPLLDEMELWQEVIKIGNPILIAGAREPSILGSLYTAYLKTGDNKNAERVIGILIKTKYQNTWEADYKSYVLSYYYLWKGDEKRALDLLESINDDDLKSYAAKSSKFKSVHKNNRFIKITK